MRLYNIYQHSGKKKTLKETDVKRKWVFLQGLANAVSFPHASQIFKVQDNKTCSCRPLTLPSDSSKALTDPTPWVLGAEACPPVVCVDHSQTKDVLCFPLEVSLRGVLPVSPWAWGWSLCVWSSYSALDRLIEVLLCAYWNFQIAFCILTLFPKKLYPSIQCLRTSLPRNPSHLSCPKLNSVSFPSSYTSCQIPFQWWYHLLPRSETWHSGSPPPSESSCSFTVTIFCYFYLHPGLIEGTRMSMPIFQRLKPFDSSW